ncbi:MAG TPA: hypothetical protein PJ984_02625 [Candidatus Saccharibacteria bacterium]|nr:hypothetical protein [Candidatus Saccharibacteria bacterium]
MSEKYEPIIAIPSDEDVAIKQQQLREGSRAIQDYEVRYTSPSDARFSALERLEAMTGSDYSIDRLKELEATTHDYTPTIGLEVEIYNSALLSKEERALSPAEQAELVSSRKRAMQEIERLGVPRDKSDEGWWEFALKPTRTPEVLTAEVRALEDSGVLHTGERYYPLHLTLGGVTSEKQGSVPNIMEHDLRGEQVFVLVHVLEASGIATTPKRLLMPAKSSKRGVYWTSGHAGIVEREPKQMRGVDFIQGVEIRSFCFSTVEELDTIVRSTQALGAALSAYQDLSRITRQRTRVTPLFRKATRTTLSPRLRSGAELEDAIRLSAVWSDFSQQAHELFSEAGLLDPSTVWHEPRPRGLLRRASAGNYGALAGFMERAEQPGSKEQDMQQRLVKLVEAAVTAVEHITGHTKNEKDLITSEIS